jgi:hypothetical protein
MFMNFSFTLFHLCAFRFQCDPGVGVDRFFHALYTQHPTRMVMLLGSACSEVTESLAKVVPYWNIVQVSENKWLTYCYVCLRKLLSWGITRKLSTETQMCVCVRVCRAVNF